MFQTLYCLKPQSIERLFTTLLTLIAAKNGVLEGLLLAYSVEKLFFFRNSDKFGDIRQRKSLFLLKHISAEMPEMTDKGVFQQNRPEAAPRLTLPESVIYA